MPDRPTYEEIETRLAELEKEVAALRREVQELRETESRYQSIFNSAKDALLIFNSEGRIVHANPEALSLYGYTLDELIRLTGRDIMHPDRHDFFEKFKKDVKRDGFFEAETLDVRKDGSVFPVEIRGAPFDYAGKRHFLAMVRNVSRRKKTEEDLKKTDERLSLALEAMSDGLWDWNVNTGDVYRSPGWFLMLEYEPNELPPTVETWSQAIHPDDKERVMRAFQAHLKGETPYYECEYRFRMKRGQWKWIMDRARVVDRDEKGNPLRMVGAHTDIHKRKLAEEALQKTHNELEKRVEERTADLANANEKLLKEIRERKQAEANLRESEERFRKFADEVSFEGLIIHKKGRILDVNQPFAKMYGYEREELIGMDALNTISPESRNIVKRNMDRRHEIAYEAMALRKDGTSFPIEIRDKTIPFHGRTVRAAAVRDLSQQKLAEAESQRLEAAFRESQKMQAIGTLAGGIAHEFNNLLMGIQGNTSLMILDLAPDHPHHKRLKNIEQQIVSGAELTKQLLGFARGGKYEVRPTNLNELIQTTSKLFENTRKEITIQRHYQENIWTVDVDRGQIEQALLNLYVNAWQAMPAGGVITLETQNTFLEEKEVSGRWVPPGRYVKICVTDTGIGIDKKALARIFDPFFTTLEMGRGSGLGLAAVYGIIKNHGGFVTVSSKKGEGSTFRIFLPASEEEPIAVEKPEKSTVRGRETILLVDDEIVVLEVGREMLEALGYRVYVAPNGQEAIELYRDHGSRIDLVILDMIMPSMTGGETYDRLKKINPAIKVILSTGYSIDGEATEILQRGCNGFIQKPFNIKELSRKIRDIMEEDCVE